MTHVPDCKMLLRRIQVFQTRQEGAAHAKKMQEKNIRLKMSRCALPRWQLAIGNEIFEVIFTRKVLKRLYQVFCNSKIVFCFNDHE